VILQNKLEQVGFNLIWDCCEIKNKESGMLKNAIIQGCFEQKIAGVAALHQGFWRKKKEESETFSTVPIFKKIHLKSPYWTLKNMYQRNKYFTNNGKQINRLKDKTLSLIVLIKICCFFIWGLLPSHIKAAGLVEKIKLEIQSAIVQNIQTSNPDIETKNISVLFYDATLSNIPDRTASFNIQIPENSTLLGKTLIKVTYLDKNNQNIQSPRIPVESSAKAWVFYVSQKIQKGHLMKESDIKSALMDIRHYPSQRIKNRQDIIGKEAKTLINTDTVLTEWMISNTPD
jgi:hypothetical protein